MEERIVSKNHKITINSRKNGTISGVNDVISFDTEKRVVRLIPMIEQ